MSYLLSNARGVGMGEYDKTGNWSWEFYPPPYDFLAPRPAAKMPAPTLGLSGCGCGGSGRCGGGCGHSHGMGLFDSGFDLTQWGIAEWAVAAGGAYLALSLLGDLFRVGKKVKKIRSRRRYKRQRTAELKRELQELQAA